MATKNELRAELQSIARERASHNGGGSPLPTLQGSEKQVAWAEEIRTNLLTALWAEYFLKCASKFSLAPDHDETAENNKQAKELAGKYRAFIGLLAKQDSAKFWIDNRDKGLYIVRTCDKRAAEAHENAVTAQFELRPELKEIRIMDAMESWLDFAKKELTHA